MIKVTNNKLIHETKELIDLLAIEPEQWEEKILDLINRSTQEIIEQHTKLLFFPCEVSIDRKGNQEIRCCFGPIHSFKEDENCIIYNCGMFNVPNTVKYLHLMIVKSLFEKGDLIDNKQSIFDNLTLFTKQINSEVINV